MDLIKINIVEVASELANRELVILFNYDINRIFINVSEDETAYTDEAQDEFNNLYDEFYNLLMELKEE